MSAATKPRFSVIVPTALAVALGLGWAFREVAFARERAKVLNSQTVNLDQVKMGPFEYDGKKVGEVGTYLEGDTPASRDFVTGRFVLAPGQTPHAPHRHVEEEVMIVEKGDGEIFCEGKTTKVGAGSVMYTTPNAPHGIVNTGETPLTFYYIKWATPASR